MNVNQKLIQEIKQLIPKIENILTQFHPNSTKRLGLEKKLFRLTEELRFLEHIKYVKQSEEFNVEVPA